MILVVDCGSTKSPDILNCVEQSGFEGEIIGINSIIDALSLENETNIKLEKFDRVIISGAPILLSQIEDKSEYLKVAELFLSLKVPILGICFGHQIIGMAYGAEVKMGQEDRNSQTINIRKDDAILVGLKPQFIMAEDHCEFIDLPSDFDLLGSSKIAEVEIMKHQSSKVYGCQFHPEVSGQNGLKFIQNFLSI